MVYLKDGTSRHGTRRFIQIYGLVRIKFAIHERINLSFDSKMLRLLARNIVRYEYRRLILTGANVRVYQNSKTFAVNLFLIVEFIYRSFGFALPRR